LAWQFLHFGAQEKIDMMTHGSLFSGIGGFDFAAELIGWTNVFHCEWNDFGKQVLRHYWPNSISYDDITKTDFTIHRGAIDVLSGGFPCQPYSAAGKRKGKEDPRHLWPEMLRAIREIQPRYVVGENVRGLTNWNGGLVFDEVQADLEAQGYEVLPFLLPACAVNAPHRRDRIWFIAYATSNRRKWKGQANETKTRAKGLHKGGELAGRLKGFCDSRIATDPEGRRQRRLCNACSETRTQEGNLSLGVFCGVCDATDTTSNGRREDHGKGEPRQSNQTSEAANWQNFPTQSPICGRNDGLPTQLDGITFPKWRNESIKGYGNAIVPQVALQIFQSISQTQESPL